MIYIKEIYIKLPYTTNQLCINSAGSWDGERAVRRSGGILINVAW